MSSWGAATERFSNERCPEVILHVEHPMRCYGNLSFFELKKGIVGRQGRSFEQ